MSLSKRTRIVESISSPNVTPLADVTTTLIVVFLITMPALMWNGIQINATKAEASHEVVKRDSPDEDSLLDIVITTKGILVNRHPVELDDLETHLTPLLAAREDKTVVVVPSDRVELGLVVKVLDVAKASGAARLALLNRKGGPR